MEASKLKPGDVFKVYNQDGTLDEETRVCLTNDDKRGLRFTIIVNKHYWCYMGERCRVKLLDRTTDDQQTLRL